MENAEYGIMYANENKYWWYQGLHALTCAAIMRHARSGGALLQIFDAGCGTGRLMELLQPIGQLHGIDFSPAAIDFCHQRHLTAAQIGDLNTWTGQPNFYDVIVSLDVLCELGIRDDQTILQNFYTCLKPGGILILNLPAFPCLSRDHDRAVHIRQRYIKKKLRASLRQCGFSVQLSTYRLPMLAVAILLKKVWQRLRPAPEPKSDLGVLPAWLNRILLAAHRLENRLLLQRIPMPWGSSVFIVAQK